MRLIINVLICSLLVFMNTVSAEEYVIDRKGTHAFIQFKISHLGYSFLLGQFEQFEGNFTFNPENPAQSSVAVKITMASLHSNHAERDKHLKGEDFFDVKSFPEAAFESTSFSLDEQDNMILKGRLTLKGVTRDIVITGRQIGYGNDPWGGFRRGFEGTTTLQLSDYNINYNLGPASKSAEVYLSIEGIRQ